MGIGTSLYFLEENSLSHWIVSLKNYFTEKGGTRITAYTLTLACLRLHFNKQRKHTCHPHSAELPHFVLTDQFFHRACGLSWDFRGARTTYDIAFEAKAGFGISWVALTKAAVAGVHTQKQSHFGCGKHFESWEGSPAKCYPDIANLLF